MCILNLAVLAIAIALALINPLKQTNKSITCRRLFIQEKYILVQYRKSLVSTMCTFQVERSSLEECFLSFVSYCTGHVRLVP